VSSTARLGLLGVSALLLVFPLALGKPGAPTHLKADEAAYFGMALSLAHDGDLAFTGDDVDRFFVEFPFQPVNNLILMSADGWRTVSYAKPFVYSLFAAPFARLGGARGMLFFNTLLLVAMVWMGAAYLRRHNEAGIAALYASGFFVLSVGFAYVYWLQPEVFNMAAVCACLFFGLPRDGEEEGLPRPQREALLAALSGAALALAVYNKPMLAAVGLAPLWSWWRERRWRQLGAWLGGAAACLALLGGVSWGLTGTPTAYLAVQRGGFTLCGPGQMPTFPSPTTASATTATTNPAASPSATQATTTPGASSGATTRTYGAETSGAAPAVAATAVTAVAAARPPATPPAVATAAAPASPPATPAPASGAAAAIAESPTGNSYRWLFRLPDTSPSELALNVVYFLFGRHAGLLPYMPFAALSVLLFLLHGRRSRPRWLLLASTAAVALFFLLQISWNWQGGGGFVGNRYFVNVYPAFLFLVTRIRPRALLPAGFAFAGLFLAPVVLAPFGLPGPEPTLQMHVRGAPFRWLPLELTLRNVPGYHRVPLGDFRVIGRREVFLPLGEPMWLFGAAPVELYLVADRPLRPLAFEVRSLAPHNRVKVQLGGEGHELDLDAGEGQRIDFAPRRASARWTIKTGTLYAYRMQVETTAGVPRTWERELPPSSCPGWPWQPKEPDSFFVGAELLYLGSPAGLEAKVFGVQWRDVAPPAAVHAGERFVVPATVVNASASEWRPTGGARVRLAYHWLDSRGATVQREGERTELPAPVPVGGAAHIELRVRAPEQPGDYQLELDPVFETVAWFSERGVKPLRLPIRVLPAGAASAPAEPR
jgi:hypothetical protein